jgi:hypothetical protein
MNDHAQLITKTRVTSSMILMKIDDKYANEIQTFASHLLRLGHPIEVVGEIPAPGVDGWRFVTHSSDNETSVSFFDHHGRCAYRVLTTIGRGNR